MTGNRADAAELMQDTFLKLWERWDVLDRIDDPTAYLFRVALNGSRMRARRTPGRTTPRPHRTGSRPVRPDRAPSRRPQAPGVPFSFRVPTAGWQQFGTISLNKSIVGPQGAEAIIFWTSYPDGDGADPCANVLSPPVGETAADLTAAISRAPGTTLVAGPSDVSVGGHSAKHVIVSVSEDVGCDPGYFYTWLDVGQVALWPETIVGDTIRVWIVDVDGTRLFIEAETNVQANAALEREIQQIVGSVHFE